MRLSLLATFLVLASGGASCAAGADPVRSLAESQTGNAPAKQTAASPGKKLPRAPVDPNKFALVLAGVGGEPEYAKKFTSQAAKLYEALVERLGFDEKQVAVLTESASAGPENGLPAAARRATADEVRKAFEAIKSASKAESTVFIVLIGHGSFDTQQSKFNLVGPDLSAQDYAGLLSNLPAGRVIFVNSASSSGEFIKPLSGNNRIIITATRSGNEQNVTTFAEPFIAALTRPDADSDKNGRISVLEAFNYATKSVAGWYKQQERLASEHALIDDNGDGTGHEEAGNGDGAIAKITYLDSAPVAEAGTDAELARLLAGRQRLEEQIERLKARKGEMKAEEYERQLEALLVELTAVSQKIKSRKN